LFGLKKTEHQKRKHNIMSHKHPENFSPQCRSDIKIGAKLGGLKELKTEITPSRADIGFDTIK